MKPPKLILLLLLLFASTVHAQETEDPCRIVEQEALEQIPKLLPEKQYPAIRQHLQSWEETCGINELICAGHMLIDLSERRFETDTVSEDIFFCLDDYQKWIADTAAINDPLLKNYVVSISEAAKKIDNPALTNSELFIRDVLAGYKYTQQAAKAYPKSELSQVRESEIRAAYAAPMSYWSVLAGAHLPSGNAKLLGQHIAVGFDIHHASQRNMVGLEFMYRFGEPLKAYEVVFDNALSYTKHYASGYMGLWYAYMLAGNYRANLWLKLNLAYEFIEAIPGEDLDGDGVKDTTGKLLHAGSIGFALRFHHRYASGTAPFIELGYYGTGYSNTGGTDISGGYKQILIGVEIPLSTNNTNLFRTLATISTLYQ